MANRIVIFGTGDMARLAHFYFTHDSNNQVVAFTVDKAYITHPQFQGLPVIPFEEIEAIYPPSEYAMFVALGYTQTNRVRAEKYNAAKAKGYVLTNYISSKATLWPPVTGDNCMILEGVVIQPFVTLGNNITLWSESSVAHDTTIQDHCFLASHVAVSGHVTIEPSCFLGANATIRDGIRVARETVVGAGVTILEDTEPLGVYKSPGAIKHSLTSDTLSRI